MHIKAGRRHSRHHVVAVDEPVGPYRETFLEPAVAHPGGAERVDALDLAEAVCGQRRQGRPEAVAGHPYFASPALQHRKVGKKIFPDFIERIFEPPMDLGAVRPIGQPEIRIGCEIRREVVTVVRPPVPPDLAAPEGDHCELPVVGHETLRGALVKEPDFIEAGPLETLCRKRLIGIRQRRGLRQPPGIGQIEGRRIGLKRAEIMPLEIGVLQEWRGQVGQGECRDLFFPGVRVHGSFSRDHGGEGAAAEQYRNDQHEARGPGPFRRATDHF